MSSTDSQLSRLAVWSDFWKYRSRDEKDLSLLRVVDFINDDPSVKTLEDWGCGKCISQKYFRPDISYTGLDGTQTLPDVKVVDLNKYVSDPPVDAVFVKHVLEHNEDWRSILKNLLKSFTRRAVIMVFTPFSDDQKGGDTYRASGYTSSNSKGEVVNIPDIRMSRVDFEQILHDGDVSYKMVELKTPTVYGQDTVYYLTKNVVRE
jgi:hypothetical protein